MTLQSRGLVASRLMPKLPRSVSSQSARGSIVAGSALEHRLPLVMPQGFEQRRSVLAEIFWQKQIHAVGVLLDPITDVSFIE
ncbi:hypothetical protein [Granulicella sp. L60]|uniref:hypothetical protein n=1 Tax=Granulicella sp. L60 TaxID=1641866 RepID=UPI00131DDA50|nr:hypothetical protein [Granulicella sp. L60]